MLTGYAIGLREHCSSHELLRTDPVSELDDDEAEVSGRILYTASFKELAGNHLQYDTIIWVLISLLLVLAWGVGLIMLLYLPFRRYVLRKDISSRKLYVTPSEIVYMVERPSFLPFWGVTKIEKHIPLALVIHIIIEQGCLQSVFGLHTFRVENIAHGKATPVDELQVIVTEASKNIQELGRGWKPTASTGEEEGTPSRMRSVTEGLAVGRSPSKSWKEARDEQPGDLLLNKLEEVKQSVKRIESLIEKSQAPPESS